MLKVIVPSADMRAYHGKRKTDQTPFSMFFQTVYIATVGQDGRPGLYPEKTEIIVSQKNAAGEPVPYPAGEYQLHPSSIVVSRDGKIEVAPRLTPIPK